MLLLYLEPVVYHFICLVKHRKHVIAIEMVNTLDHVDVMRCGWATFSNYIALSGLLPDKINKEINDQR